MLLPAPTSWVWDGECAIFDRRPTCVSIAFDRAPLSVRWLDDAPRLIDGTLRNVVPPATDGRRLWTIEYGISTYDLIARDLASGVVAVRAPLMRTTRGQFELILGSPVVAEDGTVLVYRHGSGVGGAFVAHAPDGTPRWSRPAARTRGFGPADGAIFDHDAMLGVGRGGIVYGAVGSSVVALRVADGDPVWELAAFTDLNAPAMNLSPNGDLYVVDAEGVLYAIATSSSGLASSPWPIVGGGHRLASSR